MKCGRLLTVLLLSAHGVLFCESQMERPRPKVGESGGFDHIWLQDLEKFSSDAVVVGLGECAHGDAKIEKTRGDVVEAWLKKDPNRLVVLECSDELIRFYARGGQGPRINAFATSDYLPWSLKEAMWIKDIARAQNAAKNRRVFGLDPPTKKELFDRLRLISNQGGETCEKLKKLLGLFEELENTSKFQYFREVKVPVCCAVSPELDAVVRGTIKISRGRGKIVAFLSGEQQRGSWLSESVSFSNANGEESTNDFYFSPYLPHDAKNIRLNLKVYGDISATVYGLEADEYSFGIAPPVKSSSLQLNPRDLYIEPGVGYISNDAEAGGSIKVVQGAERTALVEVTRQIELLIEDILNLRSKNGPAGFDLAFDASLLFSSILNELGVTTRDAEMARTIMLLQRKYPDEKILILSHNEHISEREGRMGQILRSRFGNAYKSIGVYRRIDQAFTLKNNGSGDMEVHRQEIRLTQDILSFGSLVGIQFLHKNRIPIGFQTLLAMPLSEGMPYERLRKPSEEYSALLWLGL